MGVVVLGLYGWRGLDIGGTEEWIPCGRRWRRQVFSGGKERGGRREGRKEGREGCIKGDSREGTIEASFHKHSTSTILL